MPEDPEEVAKLHRRHQGDFAEAAVGHEERKARRKAGKLRAATKPAPRGEPVRQDVDWRDEHSQDAPSREKHGRRRSESLARHVDRLRPAGGEAAAVPAAGGAEVALVVAITRGQCDVELTGGGIAACHLPKALARTQSSELAVGDRVRIARRPAGDRVVAAIEPRANRLSRPDPFLAHRERVLAANLDLAVVVTSLRQPPLATGLLDRILVALAHGGVPAAIAVNKVDLATSPPGSDPELALLAPYRDLGAAVVLCSTRTGAGIDELATLLAGKTAVFVGHSGVGKSSLLQALAPGLEIAIGGLSELNQRGRHTTTRSQIYRLPGEVRLIDTPGIREFGLWRIRPEELADYFDEFAAVAPRCRFSDCSHSHEPGCAVQAAAERGEIPPARYATYRRMLAALADEARDGSGSG
jgi:ribosome biogenesis GTPase